MCWPRAQVTKAISTKFRLLLENVYKFWLASKEPYDFNISVIFLDDTGGPKIVLQKSERKAIDNEKVNRFTS